LTDFAALQVLPFDDAAADTFENLRGNAVRIGTMDLRIAATALSRNLTVLTRNLVDFKKVPGLHVEDWTVESAKAS
jgi:tRNA(fMet)-specific endonuclease VapC